MKLHGMTDSSKNEINIPINHLNLTQKRNEINVNNFISFPEIFQIKTNIITEHIIVIEFKKLHLPRT